MHRQRTPKTRHHPASPEDYRRFAEESVERCLAMPSNRRRGRAVQLILAKAWAKLADQAEERRRGERPPAAA